MANKRNDRFSEIVFVPSDSPHHWYEVHTRLDRHTVINLVDERNRYFFQKTARLRETFTVHLGCLIASYSYRENWGEGKTKRNHAAYVVDAVNGSVRCLETCDSLPQAKRVIEQAIATAIPYSFEI